MLDHTRYDDWLKDRYEEKGEYEARKQNVNELVNSIAEFSRVQFVERQVVRHLHDSHF